MVEDPVADEKKKLALLQYAREQYRATQARFEWLEAKAARYLTILVFVIGSANVVMLADLRSVVEDCCRAPATYAFAVSMFLLIGSAILTLIVALFSLQPRALPTNASDPSKVIPAFLTQSLAAVAQGEAARQLEATEVIRVTNEKKATALKWSFRLLVTTVTLYALTLLLWFLQI